LEIQLEAFFELYEQNSKFYSVLLGDNGDPAFVSKLKNSIKPIIIQVFVDKPNIDKKELDFILEYTLSAMTEIMSYWFKHTNALSNIELHDFISRLMEEGVMKQLPL